jgi:hypothetical protein
MVLLLMVALMDANTLEDFSDFLVNLENNLEISIHCFNESEKLGGGLHISQELLAANHD